MIAHETADGCACITFDDGKANAMSVEWFQRLNQTLDDVLSSDCSLVAFRGREGFFSAGLNTKVLTNLDSEGKTALASAFAKTMLRIFTLALPTLALINGHAIAGGAVLALSCDLRYAVDGPFRLQMNEVAIGIPVPSWMIHIATHAVGPHKSVELLQWARAFSMAEAASGGLVHRLLSPGEMDAVMADTAKQASSLNKPAFATTRQRFRGASTDAVLASLEAERSL
jgi:enoyl-CoA hydratase